jgi:hypothetical protein
MKDMPAYLLAVLVARQRAPRSVTLRGARSLCLLVASYRAYNARPSFLTTTTSTGSLVWMSPEPKSMVSCAW